MGPNWLVVSVIGLHRLRELMHTGMSAALIEINAHRPTCCNLRDGNFAGRTQMESHPVDIEIDPEQVVRWLTLNGKKAIRV